MGSDSGTAVGASSAAAGSDPTQLPTAKGPCPMLSNLNGSDVSFAGQAFTVWSGDPAHGPGPLLLYWHASGSNSMEPTWAIQMSQIRRITDAGGALVAQVSSTQSGQSTAPNAWYAGDDDSADEVVACAIQNQKIDVRRIWSAGYKSGGFQSVHMWYARSGYLAGAISYSGGELFPGTLQDPSHVPVGVASHGAAAQDTAGDLIDFAAASHAWEMRSPSAFIVDCDDGGGRSDQTLRTLMAPQAIQMLWDHPFGVTPEPYANGLPGDWPATCVPPPVPADH
jgi:poly(3-hydroxybutyrate) depolymerase